MKNLSPGKFNLHWISVKKGRNLRLIFQMSSSCLPTYWVRVMENVSFKIAKKCKLVFNNMMGSSWEQISLNSIQNLFMSLYKIMRTKFCKTAMTSSRNWYKIRTMTCRMMFQSIYAMVVLHLTSKARLAYKMRKIRYKMKLH